MKEGAAFPCHPEFPMRTRIKQLVMKGFCHGLLSKRTVARLFKWFDLGGV